jgi:uncharacterized coiled-coil protein SlyX
MSETLIGIAVGTAVALIGQLIAALSAHLTQKQKDKKRAKAVVKLLLQELSAHETLYEHHLALAEESINQKGVAHSHYSYQPVATDAYDKVFLAYWDVIPNALLQPIIAYYHTVTPVNMLSGSFGTPTPVPVIAAKDALLQAQAAAAQLKLLLQKQA